MRRNPPWTDKLLNAHWAALEARVGPALMPQPDESTLLLRMSLQHAEHLSANTEADAIKRQKKIERIRKAMAKASFKEYGCGHYGCVMPTGTPGIVIKVTTDQTEAAFVAAYLSMKPAQRPVGIVPYHRLIAIRSESRLKRPVFVLWRDEADYVGKIGYWIAEQARDFDPSKHSLRTMPLFLLDPITGKNGLVRRSCTERYKVRPVERFIRSVVGRKRKDARPVEQWFGVSTDEAEREKISQRKGWTFRYPLLYDIPMSRGDCIAFLKSKGVAAPKSACVGCPYRNRERWATIRDDPELWADAVDFDATIRRLPGLDSHAFLHPQRVPLPQVDWSKGVSREEHFGMKQECVGMCGV